MTQWGSKELGDQGYSPIEILRYFYGDDMYINSAEEISGIPASWPGYTLGRGLQRRKGKADAGTAHVIAGAYPALSKISADGIYGPATANAVKNFSLCSVFRRREKLIILHGTKYRRFMWESQELRS